MSKKSKNKIKKIQARKKDEKYENKATDFFKESVSHGSKSKKNHHRKFFFGES